MGLVQLLSFANQLAQADDILEEGQEVKRIGTRQKIFIQLKFLMRKQKQARHLASTVETPFEVLLRKLYGICLAELIVAKKRS